MSWFKIRLNQGFAHTFTDSILHQTMDNLASHTSPHTFHIPVMGLGYTVDSPIKVAPWGISSVISIMDDQLLEEMRKVYSAKYQMDFTPIADHESDARAKRITAFLDLSLALVNRQVTSIKNSGSLHSAQVQKYIQLLPESHPLKKLNSSQKILIDREFTQSLIQPGSIDINIMTKVDKINYDKTGTALSREYSDALSALRGYANSQLDSMVIFSAGMNPALFAYAENFADFFPDDSSHIKKRICLKVSDYRSALIQGKFLAKKGLWVSEFRIESGLNCGGHAFATEGFLIGPILEEFKAQRAELEQTLRQSCNQTLGDKNLPQLTEKNQIKITYQGGIGTSEEDQFLKTYYELDGTGWGSPFLLVPEATSVDSDTLDRLIQAKQSDYFLSDASPLGVPFNNLKTSSGESQRKARIAKGRPGSPCYKKFLSFNTDYSQKPICTASRQYQHLKSKMFEKGEIPQQAMDETLAKDCLCEGLGAPALLSNGISPKRNLSAVTICPGPNLAYFKGTFSLQQMVDHIYGRLKIKLSPSRPHLFVKELELYLDYLRKEVEKTGTELSAKKESYFRRFQSNLQAGIAYYRDLGTKINFEAEEAMTKIQMQLDQLAQELNDLNLKLQSRLT